jgi:hypothetical protein
MERAKNHPTGGVEAPLDEELLGICPSVIQAPVAA